MALANKTRFIAAASLALLLAAPVASAKDKMGKEIRVEDVLKGHKSGGSQTARKPAQKSGGDGGDDGAYGVERPAPEGRDPNEVTGGGERSLDGDGSGATAKGAGGNQAGGGDDNMVPPGRE
jgi:hypothetical protein